MLVTGSFFLELFITKERGWGVNVHKEEIEIKIVTGNYSNGMPSCLVPVPAIFVY
jgi:hypothetical protein